MPMMIVNDDEFESELTNSSIPSNNSITPARILDLPTKGRNEGDNNVPNSLRQIIGETSEIEGVKPAIELANTFGISRSSISAYANGSTSTKTYDKQPNLDFLNNAKYKISKKAVKRLAKAIDEITDEKLMDAKPVELAVIAKSMSAVVRDMEPEAPKSETEKTGPTFVFYSPQIRDERQYQIINARE